MRLIDADALKAQFRTNEGASILGHCVSRLVKADTMVDHTPTIDAVPVVRCRDCKKSMLWRMPTDKVIGECLIRKMNSEDEQFCMVGADDFCSYGERRSE